MTADAAESKLATPIIVGGQGALAAEQFRLLVESVNDYAIFLLDATGHVASWSAGARSIKGYSSEEILGKHISTFYTPEELALGKPQQLLARAAAEGRVEDFGWRLRKDGQRFWADVVITAVRNPDGQVLGFVKVTRDLTERRAAEEKLRQTEELLAATLYSIGDGVLATDERGRVTLINRVSERLTGWTEREVLGRHFNDVLHLVNEHTRAQAANPIERVLAEGTVVGLANHTALIARDGSEYPIADTAAPIFDAMGETRGAVLVFRDVATERRAEEALRQSQERLALMIGSVQDYAIFLLDTQGLVVTWNPGAERIKGYAEAEIVGQHFSRFFPRADQEARKPQRELEFAAQHGRFEVETWRVRKDGSQFWANVVISAVRDAAGVLVGFTKVTRDLTERKRMEEERVRLAQAQEAVRLRDEFLSIASHELKTPLTALQLQLQAALDAMKSSESGPPARIRKAARAGTRLADLIDTLLDVSRLSRERMSLSIQHFDLVDVARQVIESLSESAALARCTLALRATGPIFGAWDRFRMQQVITNLLGNAIKYAVGSPITLTMERQGDGVTLQVCDRGPGLREGDLPRIFQRFERASEFSQGGLGLGLYVARQVAEAHGGSIEAANLEGGGACFTLHLPLVYRSDASAAGVERP